MTEVTIRPYQSDGIEFILSRKTKRALIADEPGLGKSMQALLTMRDMVPAPGRVLIVCTGDAVGVWEDEVAFWLDEPVSIYAGPKATVDALWQPGITITNYARVANALLEYQWAGVIFDESQQLRNRNTRTLFKAVRHAFDNKSYGLSHVPVIFTSGTPVVKHAGDLWPILHLIDRKRFNSYWKFVQKYCIVWQDTFGWHVEGVTNVQALWKDLEDVAVRRTVEEVQPSLPPMIRQRIPLEMSPRQAQAYKELEDDLIAAIDNNELLLAPGRLSRDTRLRQLLVSPRLIGISDDGAAIPFLTRVAEESRRPFVVFTPFAEALPILEAALVGADRPVYLVHGGMGAKLKESVELFKLAAAAGEAPVLAATVTMGKSWSVSRASHEAYMLGFDWNATTMEQAERRIRREGQTKTSFSRYLVHRGTMDLDVLDVLSGKKLVADVILDRRKVGRRL